MPIENARTILFVSQSLSGGGAERAAAYFCGLLAERCWNVHLLILQNTRQEYNLSKAVVLHRPDSSDYGKVAKIQFIRRVVKELCPARVVAFLYEPMICSYLATRGLGCEFWTTVRNNPNYYPKGVVRRRVSKLLFRTSDLCLLQTKGQSPLIGFRNEGDYAVIPNAVGTIFLEMQHEYSMRPRRFIAVGRLEEQKNYPLLLQAFALVAEADPRCTLDIYGRGSLKSSLEYWIRSHGMEKRVTIHEPVQDIEKVLSASDIFVSTSRYEGMPNALMEAMAVGLACVSVDCKTGPSDLINNGVNGYLVPERANSKTLASHMLKCIQNPQGMQLMGERARQTILEAYSEKVIQNRLIEVFSKGADTH